MCENGLDLLPTSLVCFGLVSWFGAWISCRLSLEISQNLPKSPKISRKNLRKNMAVEYAAEKRLSRSPNLQHTLGLFQVVS
jgi:hypothetical protein